MRIFDLDTVVEVFQTVRRNPLRAFLTSLGVFWGVFMLIVMVGVGNGLNNFAASQMNAFSVNSVFVWGQSTTLPYKGQRPGRRIQFTNEDSRALANLPQMKTLAPSSLLGGWPNRSTVVAGSKAGQFRVLASYPVTAEVKKQKYPSGRFLNETDIQEQRKVAVIGKQVVQDLFPDTPDPVGQWVEISGVFFQVVGLTEPLLTSGEGGERDEQTVYVPFSTYQRAFNEPNRVHWFQMVAAQDSSAQDLEDSVREVLMARHNVHPDDTKAIGAFNAGVKFEETRSLFDGITLIIWIVGTMTLLAGVVGVCNIMLISVRERYAEIGLRKALGAQPGIIVITIMCEALLLTLTAGYFAIVVGIAGLLLFGEAIKGSDIPLLDPHPSFNAAIAAAITLVIAGVLAGILPARQAAKVSPIESLRDE